MPLLEAIVRRTLFEFDWAMLLYLLAVNSCYVVLFVSAALEMGRQRTRQLGENRWVVLGSDLAPSIAVIAPAYNEELTIVASMRGLLALNYPNLQVVVVNDGSGDATLAKLQEEFSLVEVATTYHPAIPTRDVRAIYRSPHAQNLLVVDKVNGGKADALNMGLNLCRADLVCAIDADTLIEQDALQRLVAPFLLDRRVVATGGTIRVANGCRIHGNQVVEVRVPTRLLPGVQVVEYLRAFLFGRLGWNRLGGNLIISGAFGLFQRDAVLAVGGYRHDTVGEDMDLVVKLREDGLRRGTAHRVEFVPDPVAWTEVPEQARTLGRQRDRWHRGLADVLWRHRHLFLNPRYGALGLVCYPYFVFIELLAPIAEALGFVATVVGWHLGLVNHRFALLYFTAAYGYALLLSIATLLLEELSYRRYRGLPAALWLLLWAAVETFGYRQMTVYWRLRGIVNHLRKNREWGAMQRKGFQQSAVAGS